MLQTGDQQKLAKQISIMLSDTANSGGGCNNQFWIDVLKWPQNG